MNFFPATPWEPHNHAALIHKFSAFLSPTAPHVLSWLITESSWMRPSPSRCAVITAYFRRCMLVADCDVLQVGGMSRVGWRTPPPPLSPQVLKDKRGGDISHRTQSAQRCAEVCGLFFLCRLIYLFIYSVCLRVCLFSGPTQRVLWAQHIWSWLAEWGEQDKHASSGWTPTQVSASPSPCHCYFLPRRRHNHLLSSHWVFKLAGFSRLWQCMPNLVIVYK